MKKYATSHFNTGPYTWERFVYIDYTKNEYDALLKNTVTIIEILLNLTKAIKTDRTSTISYF